MLSPDGRWAATGGRRADHVRLFDAASGRQVHTLPVKDALLAFSPDSRFLVTGTPEAFTCWRIENGQPVWKVAREDDIPSQPVFAPDGGLLALTLSRVAIAFVDPVTGEEVAALPSKGKALGFSRDGRFFFSAGKVLDSIQVWDLPLLRRDLRVEGFDWEPASTLAPIDGLR